SSTQLPTNSKTNYYCQPVENYAHSYTKKLKPTISTTNFHQNTHKSCQSLNHSKLESQSANKTQTQNSNNSNPSQNNANLWRNLKVYSSQEKDLCEENIEIKSTDLVIVKGLGFQILKSDLNDVTNGIKTMSIDSLIINKIVSSDHRGISKIFDKYNQISFKVLFFPLFIRQNHWSLLVIDSSKSSITFFDSIFQIDYNLIRKIITVLSKYIGSLKHAGSWSINANFDYPKQINNVHDCGAYVCQYAKYYIFNQLLRFGKNSTNFQLIHLNINSILNHIIEVHDMLSTQVFDVVLFSETKLDDTIPNSFYKNDHYFKIRLDRTRHGGGLLVFIKNNLVVKKSNLLEDLELIYFQLQVRSQKLNFVYTYRAPSMHEQLFLDKLDDFIHSLNLSEPLFIIGDLNIDFNNGENSKIKEFMTNNELINFVKKATRNSSKFYKNTNSFRSTSTMIDLLLHNGDFIIDTDVLNCPFSDHCFVLAKLEIKKKKKSINSVNKVECRNLSASNMAQICLKIEEANFKQMREIESIEGKWTFFKDAILNIVDEIAPIRKISINSGNQFPWYDEDLFKLKHLKNTYYKRFARSRLPDDKQAYEHFNKTFNALNDEKMIEYFKDKSMNDFKSSKKFWEFYSSKISIKSDKSSSNPISHVKFNGKVTDNKLELCNIFNCFFTSISSSSNVSIKEAEKFIDEQIESNDENQ
ncbi:RNA-directed DNA polymerase from mobile element jockey-like, partial [Brachionus plicatilis]